jgi:MFS family permease
MDLMPEASSAPPAARRRYFWRSLTMSLVFLATYLGSAVAVTMGGSQALVAGLTLAAFVCVILLGYEFVTLIRTLDELQQMIQIRAMAIGFASVLIVMTALGLLSELFADGALDGVLSLAAAISMPAGLLAYILTVHIVKRRYE